MWILSSREFDAGVECSLRSEARWRCSASSSHLALSLFPRPTHHTLSQVRTKECKHFIRPFLVRRAPVGGQRGPPVRRPPALTAHVAFLTSAHELYEPASVDVTVDVVLRFLSVSRRMGVPSAITGLLMNSSTANSSSLRRIELPYGSRLQQLVRLHKSRSRFFP